MTVTIPLAQMTAAEKLALIDDIWADLEKTGEDLPSPDWHDEVLADIDRRLASGEETISDWEDAKARLLAKFGRHES